MTHALPKCPNCYGDGFRMGLDGPYPCGLCKGEGRRKVAALALLWRNGEVLAVSRKDNHDDLGFPGGKVEPMDDSPDVAMVRELDEETGVIAKKWVKAFETEDSAGYWAITFHVHDWEGEPTSREGSAVLWVPPRRLLESSCSWAAYNRALFASPGGRLPV